MPSPLLIKAISAAVTNHGLDENVGDRIASWIKQSEGGEFAATEKEEQLQKILNKLPSYQSSGNSNHEETK
jgi:hypothetical protein